MARVLALVDDLFFQAKIVETAKHAGVDLGVCATPDALLGEMAKDPPRLVVVDLNARSRPVEALERIQSSARNAPVVAFLSHVETDLAARARAGGCRARRPRAQNARAQATPLAGAQKQTTRLGGGVFAF
jgi:DNA-binding NarL/FixJ family response regulator